MKIENWNGNEIRFVDYKDEWWAVAKDVATALGYKNPSKAVSDHIEDSVDKVKIMLNHKPDSQNGNVVYKSETTIINELGIYSLVFNSKLPKAKEFRKWVFNIIKELRQASGIEGFQVFRMMDKQQQKNCMDIIHNGMREPTKREYMKANTIANKAVSNMYGFPKMVKKGDMSPEMLKDREGILEDTVKLMVTKDEYGLDISVSDAIYTKHNG